GFRSGVSCHFIDRLRPVSTVNTVPQSQRNPFGPISLHSPYGTGSMLNSTNFSFDHVYSFGHQWVSLLIKKSNAFSRGTDISGTVRKSRFFLDTVGLRLPVIMFCCCVPLKKLSCRIPGCGYR